MIALQRVLVATDFGDASETALSYGRALTRAFGASLAVLHVTDNVMLNSVGIEGYVAAPEAQFAIEESARKQLAALVTESDRRELRATTALRSSNATALAIVNYAREINADLIILGTHGRGAMAQLIMGSVAERVVRTAPCPVLTVKHPEHEFVIPDALMRLAKA